MLSNLLTSSSMAVYSEQVRNSWRLWLRTVWFGSRDGDVGEGGAGVAGAAGSGGGELGSWSSERRRREGALQQLGARQAVHTLDVLWRLQHERESIQEDTRSFPRGDLRMFASLIIVATSMRHDILLASGSAWLELGWEAAQGAGAEEIKQSERRIASRRDHLLDIITDRATHHVIALTLGREAADNVHVELSRRFPEGSWSSERSEGASWSSERSEGAVQGSAAPTGPSSFAALGAPTTPARAPSLRSELQLRLADTRLAVLRDIVPAAENERVRRNVDLYLTGLLA